MLQYTTNPRNFNEVETAENFNQTGKAYRLKYGIPRVQSLAAKAITLRRKEHVQRSIPWEKAPMFLKAQEEKREKAAVAQRKKTARAKA